MSRAVGGWALCMLCLGFGLANADAATREHRIKAAFLYNLAQFVDWPDHHALKNTAKLTICTFDGSSFRNQLALLEQRRAKGREIQLMPVGTEKIKENCNIVFFDGNQHPSASLLEKYAANGTLTVGELQSFIDSGGIIALPTVDNRVRLMINFEKAKSSGLYVSAHLLEVATVVQAAPDR